MPKITPLIRHKFGNEGEQPKLLRKSSDIFIPQNFHNLLKWYAMNYEKKKSQFIEMMCYEWWKKKSGVEQHFCLNIRFFK